MLIKQYFGRYIVLGVSCLNKVDAQPRELSDLVTLRPLVVPHCTGDTTVLGRMVTKSLGLALVSNYFVNLQVLSSTLTALMHYKLRLVGL